VIKKLYHLTGIELTPILAINQQQQTCTFFTETHTQQNKMAAASKQMKKNYSPNMSVEPAGMT